MRRRREKSNGVVVVVVVVVGHLLAGCRICLEDFAYVHQLLLDILVRHHLILLHALAQLAPRPPQLLLLGAPHGPGRRFAGDR